MDIIHIFAKRITRMGHFSKKYLACRFAAEHGFDFAHRDGLYKGQALYVGDFKWWNWRARKHGCIGLPFYIVIEKGVARQLDTNETMNVLCGRS